MRFLRKLLFKVLLVLLVLTSIFVVLPLVLFHKSVSSPKDDYVSTHEQVFYQSLDNSIQGLITDTNQDTIDIVVFESFLNRAIQKELSKDNHKFLNETYKDDLEYRYMKVFSDRIGLKGVWTELNDDSLKVTVGVDAIVTNKITYQTAVVMDLGVKLNESNQYQLSIDKIKVGKLGLPLGFGVKVTNFILDKLQGKTLDSFIKDSLPFGDFDSSTRTYRVGEDELTDYLYEIDPTFSALLKVIYKEELLTMDFSDNGFEIHLNMGKFRRLITDYDPVTFNKLESEGDKAALMSDIATAAAVDAVLNPLDPKITLDEQQLNQILDYQLKEKVSFEYPIKYKLNGVTKEYLFKSSVLFIKMIGDELSVHLLMTLSEKDQTEAFEMQFNLTTTVDMNANGDMVLTILSSNIGEITLDTVTLKSMIDIFDSNLMSGNSLVIPKEKLNEMFQGASLSFDDAYVESGKLNLHFGLE